MEQEVHQLVGLEKRHTTKNPGMDVEQIGVDVRVKFDDSRSNGS